jgi:hypothetical protein
MSLSRRWRKIFRITAVSFVILGISLTAWAQIERHLMRARAERLLADVRALQLHKASWSDIQAFRVRWKDWGAGEDSSPCTPADCRVGVSIERPIQGFLWQLGERHPYLNFLGLAYSFFQRGATANATLTVLDGTITESRFTLSLTVFSSPFPDWPSAYGLVGIARQEAEGLGPMDFIPNRVSHPEYWAGRLGGCTFCIKLVSSYTPLVDRETMLKLTDFNFSCITRWTACTTESDILPGAWKIYEQDAQGREERMKAFEECRLPYEILAREYKSIVIADIASRQAIRSAEIAYLAADIRVVRNLKGQINWPLNKTQAISVFDRGQAIDGRSFIDMVAGKRYILLGLFTKDKPGSQVLALDDCGVIPYTDQNLAAIQRGIDESTARDRKLRELGFTPDEHSPPTDK